MMKTKLIVLMIALTTVTQVGTAQEYNCDDSYTIFNSAVSTKDFSLAYKTWHNLVSGTCDETIKARPKAITNGGYVIGRLIKGSEGEQKKALLDSLFFCYKKGIEILGRDPKLIEKNGLAFAQYKMKTNTKDVHTLLKESIASLQEKSNPSSIKSHYSACFYEYKAGNLQKGDMVEEFIMLDAICDKAIASSDVKDRSKDAWKKIKDWLPSIANTFMTCEVIVEVYQPKVEAAPSDLALLKKTSKLLGDKGCENKEVSVEFYLQVADLLLSIEPSADGYFAKAKLESATKKEDAAKISIQKAYDLCGDGCDLKMKIIEYGIKLDRSKWMSVLSAEFPNDGRPTMQKARNAAKQVNNTSLDPNLTKRKLANCKAIELALKAKAMDDKVKSAADALINSCKEGLPECSELFQLGLTKGDKLVLGTLGSITVDCK